MNWYLMYRLFFRFAHNGKEPRKSHLFHLGMRTVTNATDTSDRKPWGGGDWIDYWKSFSKKDANIMRCTCCGEKISFGFYTQTGICKAVGAHIDNPAYAKDRTKPQYLIVPMCDECNKKYGETLEVRVNNIAVEEMDAQIVQS